MKRQRSHRRHRRRDVTRKMVKTSTRVVKRWFDAFDRMGVPKEILFAPLALLCGIGPRVPFGDAFKAPSPGPAGQIFGFEKPR